MSAAVSPARTGDVSASPERSAIEAKLLAYMHPNVPEGSDQRAAFDRAVDEQLAFEARGARGELPDGVDELTIGSYTIRRGEWSGADATPSGICRAALAILFNAGLLRRALPQARKL